MGSVFEYLTIADAAKELNVSERQVRRYIKQGYLESVTNNNRERFVDLKDVRSLKKAKAEKRYRPDLALTKVALLEAKYQELRKQVNALMRMNDMWDETETLNMNDRELAALHERAYELLKLTWSPMDENYWTEVFVRMKMDDLDKMTDLVEDEPWRPFYALVQAMFAKPHDPDNNKLLLSKGLQNMERLAQVYSSKISNDDIHRFRKMVDTDQKQVKRVLKKVESKRAKAKEKEVQK